MNPMLVLSKGLPLSELGGQFNGSIKSVTFVLGRPPLCVDQ